MKDKEKQNKIKAGFYWMRFSAPRWSVVQISEEVDGEHEVRYFGTGIIVPYPSFYLEEQMELISIPTPDDVTTDWETVFDKWWEQEGQEEATEIAYNHTQAIKKLCKTAWSNGAYAYRYPSTEPEGE